MSKRPTVTVRGEGQVEGPPELASVAAVLHTSGRTAAEVTRSLSELSKQVDAALPDLSKQVDAALPDLLYDSVRTEPLSITPVFDRRSGAKITGYAGRYSTRLTLADFDGLSDLVVALTGLPGAEVDGPTWSLRPGSPLERAARRAAVTAAIARARDYADALGATLGELLDLSDTDGGSGGGMPRMFAMAKGGGEPVELDLEPQPQSVSAAVTARFTLDDVPTPDALPT